MRLPFGKLLVVLGLSFLPQAGLPQSTPKIQINKIIPSSSGIEANVSLSYTKTLSVVIATEDPTTGQFSVPFVRWMILNLPSNQTSGSTAATVDVTIPVILNNPNKQYLLTFYVGPDELPNGSSTSYEKSSRVISGYSNQITKSFSFKFNANTLTVSANTGDTIAILKASWIIEDSTGLHTTTEIKRQAQNPSVDLFYADLGTPTKLPAIRIALENPETHQQQEADLQISINASGTPTQQAKTGVTAEPNSQPAKQKFSWGELSKTVLGSILKYFAA